MVRGRVSTTDVWQPGQQPPAQVSVLLPLPAIGRLCSPQGLAPAVYPHLLVATSRLPEEAAAAAQAEVAVALHELYTEADIKWIEMQAEMLAVAAAAAALTAAQENLKVVEKKAQQERQRQQQQR